MRIAVLTSSSAAGIDRLIAGRERGSVYDLALVITSEPRLAQREVLENARVPVVAHPIRQYHADRGLPLRNLHSRVAYDAETASILARFGIDYVLLTGYRYIVTQPLLAAYEQKMIAFHDGDLTVVDEHGRRRFGSLHAVREAILSGQESTRSSAYLVTREVGEGPLFLLSGAWPVAPLARDARARGDANTLCEYSRLHRSWMVQNTWGEMMVRGCELLAAGNIQVVRDVVFVDGAPGPCRLGHAPGDCHEPHSPIDSSIPSSCPFIATAPRVKS